MKNESQFAVSLHESFMSILLIPLNKSSSAVIFPDSKKLLFEAKFCKSEHLVKV